MAHARRKSWTRPVPMGATITHDDAGQPVEATWVDKKGKGRKAPLTRGKDGSLRVVFTSTRFTIEFTDSSGKRRSTRGYKDKQATRQKASQLERTIERREVGLIDPYEEHTRRPLKEHVEEYESYLRALNVKPRYRGEKLQYIRTVLAGIGATALRDLDHSRVVAFLDSRAAGRPVPILPAEPEWYSLGEAAQLTGLSKTAIGVRISTNELPAKGRLRDRRIHRDGVAAILASLAKGAGASTLHQTINAIRSFSRWLADTDRVAVDPLRRLRKPRGLSGDQRHARAPLSGEELRRLLTTTRASKRRYKGLNGESRFMLYCAAARTGLRASALASLTVSSFNLAGDPPSVTLQPRSDKSGRGKIQPIPADLVELLSDWLRGKPAGALCWPGRWAADRRGAAMLRGDLAAANVPYVVQVGGVKMYRDFHAVRHVFISHVSKATGDDRASMLLAGHTCSTVTSRYSHRALAELAEKVNRLPRLLASEQEEAPQEENRLLAFLLAFQRLPSVPFDALPYPF